jgi:hypothetical protein
LIAAQLRSSAHVCAFLEFFMLVRFLTSISGHGVNHLPGEEVNWPDKEAKRYIERGMAEPVAKDEKPAGKKAPASRKPQNAAPGEGGAE